MALRWSGLSRAACVAVGFGSVVCATQIHAGLLPDTEREQLVARALDSFWIQARDAEGMLLQPASATERATVPVPPAVIERAFDVGEASGLGQWCGLEWRTNLTALADSARSRGFSDKQVTFIVFLHRAAQDRIAGAMTRSFTCSERDRASVHRMLDRFRSHSLRGVSY